MVRVPVSALPREELCAGDKIEYYCPSFAEGDHRGFRSGTVLQVVPDDDHPVHVDTGDVLWKLKKVCRVETAAGRVIQKSGRLRRTIRTFTLKEGKINMPTRLQLLGREIAAVRDEVMITSIQHTVVVSKQRATTSPVTTPGILSVAATDSRPDQFLNVESGNLTEAAIDSRPDRCESFESDECNSETHCVMLGENMDGGTEHTGDSISREFVDIGNGADVIEVDCDGDDVMNGEFVVEPAANNMVDSNVDSRPQLAKGMRFVNATSGLHHVQAYAMANKKQVKMFRRSGIDSRITCTSEGCPFFVQIYKRKSGVWAISTLHLEHMNCVSVAKPTTRQIAELPTFVSAVHANNAITAAALIEMISERDGISLAGQKRSVYRARQLVLEKTEKELRKSYESIAPYLQTFRELNPGSTAEMERDDEGRFKRAIVVVQTVASSLPHNQRILGLDCSHSKCQYYGGQQMHLVGRDGNMQNVTIAFALVPAEYIESYSWFFKVLKKSGIDIAGYPIFCDRNRATLSVAQTLQLNLKFCTAHIARNFVHEHQNVKQQHKNLVWQLQVCYTEDEYNSKLAWIGMELGKKAMTYLKSIPPNKWCVFANIGDRPLYGWRTSNFVESVFGTQLTLGIRGLSPFDFIKAVIGRIMARTYKRNQLVRKWLDEGRKITPAAQKTYDMESSNIGHYAIEPSSEDVYFVYNRKSPMRVMRRVTVSKSQCTCGFMDQHHIPCRHLIAAMSSIGKLPLIFDHFECCYHVKSYARAFMNRSVNLPLESEMTAPDKTTQPPLQKKALGRPPTKRLRSNGESDTSATYMCSRCKTSGHNVRTCRKMPQ